MEALRVAICEDSPAEQDNLLALIEKSGVSARCDVFNSGEDFLASYQPGTYGLIFMDIYMGALSGVETVAAIRKADENVPVAFVTSSTEHTLESYRLGVLRYIEKPVTEKAVCKLLEFARLKQESAPRLVLKIDGQEVGIPFDRIVYAEQKAHHLVLYLTGGEVVQAVERLDVVAPQFEGQAFFRCHKSYLVNLACIQNFDRALLVFRMKEGSNVHIRRESMGEARKAYENYLFSKARGTDDE